MSCNSYLFSMSQMFLLCSLYSALMERKTLTTRSRKVVKSIFRSFPCLRFPTIVKNHHQYLRYHPFQLESSCHRLRGGDHVLDEVATADKDYDLLSNSRDITETGDRGVLKIFISPGHSSTGLANGDEISAFIVGSVALHNGEQGTVFLNYTRTPFTFRFGKKHVVPGLELGIASMNIGEKSAFLVRSDYGYGEQMLWEGIDPNVTIRFDVELVGCGERDLTDGSGGVLFRTIFDDGGVDQPGPLDEVLVSMSAVRSYDGVEFVRTAGPEWLDLSCGLLPRGVRLGIEQMTLGMTARIIVTGSWAFSDRQLAVVRDEMLEGAEERIDPSPFFRPNISYWAAIQPDVQMRHGLHAIQNGCSYIYNVTLVNMNSVVDVSGDGGVLVKKLDQGGQEFYLSEIEDGDEVIADIKGQIIKDGFRDENEHFLATPIRLTANVGDGSLPRGLDLAMGSLHRGQASLVRLSAAYTTPGEDDKCILALPQGVTIELDVLVTLHTQMQDRSVEERLRSCLARKTRGNTLLQHGKLIMALKIYTKALKLLEGVSPWTATAYGPPSDAFHLQASEVLGRRILGGDKCESATWEEALEEVEHGALAGLALKSHQSMSSKNLLQHNHLRDEPSSPLPTVTSGGQGTSSEPLSDAAACLALQVRTALVALHNNLALVHLRLSQPQLALEAANQAILLQPDCVKAVARRGMALVALGRIDEARQDLKRLPGMAGSDLRAAMEAANTRDRKIFGKIFS